jgi:hypothetical protein
MLDNLTMDNRSIILVMGRLSSIICRQLVTLPLLRMNHAFHSYFLPNV